MIWQNSILYECYKIYFINFININFISHCFVVAYVLWLPKKIYLFKKIHKTFSSYFDAVQLAVIQNDLA